MSRERLYVDWTRCDGRGLCQELLPELLVADDWGYPLSRTGEAAPVVPARVREHADRAVQECPRLALSIVVDRRPADRKNLDRRSRT